MCKHFLRSLIFVCTPFVILSPSARAEESPRAQYVDCWISGTGYENPCFLTDGDTSAYATSSEICCLTIESFESFSALYLMFDLEYGQYTITDNLSGMIYLAGQNNFLHEYVTFDEPTTSVTIDFTKKPVALSEIQTFTQGTPPRDIQVWQAPLDGKADLLLLSAHGDDDHLFFAGLLPLYAKERGYDVQVAYLTDHRNLTTVRTHEMLNGLWTVGVRNYPVFGSFIDFRVDDLNQTYERYAKNGTSKEELLGFVVEQLRRFKPKVVVSHDFDGEYGHGMHRMYTDLLVQALDIIPNENMHPSSAQKYGTWEVQKTYIHLYKQNPILMEYDVPLKSFNGMSAFEVSQLLGFPCHESQQDGLESGGYIYGLDGQIKTSKDITLNSPCEFGLYRTTVGPDILCNDFMENIVSNQDLLRQEQERLDAELAQQTEAPISPTDATQAPAEKAETSQTEMLSFVLICGGVLTSVIIIAVFLLVRRRNAK